MCNWIVTASLGFHICLCFHFQEHVNFSIVSLLKIHVIEFGVFLTPDTGFSSLCPVQEADCRGNSQSTLLEQFTLFRERKCVYVCMHTKCSDTTVNQAVWSNCRTVILLLYKVVGRWTHNRFTVNDHWAANYYCHYPTIIS